MTGGGPIDWARQQQTEREQQPARHTVDTITSDALDQLYAERDANERRAEAYGQAWKAAKQRAEQAAAERDKACTAFNAKVMQLEKTNQERATLHQLFEGFGRLLATSSRDWGAYRVDAWLWAVVLGWDCTKPCDIPECDHDVLEQFAREFGWDEAAVAKARRYHATVQSLSTALTEPKESSS